MNQPTPAPEPPQLADVLQQQLNKMQAIIQMLANPSPLQLAGPTPEQLESILLSEIAATVVLIAAP